MRWKLSRSKLLFGLLPIVALLFYVLTVNTSIFADRSYVSIDLNQNINDTLDLPNDGSSPIDYSAADNFAIAAGVIMNKELTPFYSTHTTGEVVANIMNYTQEVENTKVVKGSALFAESLSLSTFASVAEQKYYDNNYIMYRKAKTSGKKVVSWPNEIKEMASDFYADKYGVIPREITKYAVTKDAVLSGELINSENGLYTYQMELNADMAQKYSRREMMTFANVTAEPIFYDCRITFTIDDNWRVHKVESYDYYQIAMMGGVKCTSNLSEEFMYEGDMPERAQIFVDYVPTGDNEEIVPEKSAADYLQEAFGDYLTGGKDLNLQAKVKLLGAEVDLTAAIDIDNMQFKFKVGDIFAAYTGDVYIDNGTHKGKLSANDISKISQMLDMDMSSITGIFDDPDILGKLFENTVISETDTHVYIPMKFNMLSIDFDVSLNLIKSGETVKAESISGNIDLSSLIGTPMVVNAEIQLVDSLAMPEIIESEYVSYSPIIDAAINAVNAKAHSIDVTLNVANGKLTEKVRAKLNINRETLSISGTVNIAGAYIDLALIDDSIYIKANNIMLTAKLSEMDKIIAQIKNLLPPSSGDIIQSVLPMLSDVLPNITVDSVFDIIGGINVTQNKIVLPITSKNGNTANIALNYSPNSITGAEIDNLKLGEYVVGIKAQLESFDKNLDITLPNGTNESNYINILDFTQFIDPILKLANSRTFTIDITNGNIKTPFISGDFSGTLSVCTNPLSVQADFKFRTHAVKLTYANDNIFLAINNIRLKLDLNDIDSISEIIGGIMPMTEANPLGSMLSGLVSGMLNGDTSSIIGNLTGGLNLANLLDCVNLLSYADNALTVGLNLGEFSMTLKASANADNGLYVQILNLNYGTVVTDTSLNAEIKGYDKEFSPSVSEIETYVDVADLASYINPIKNTITKSHYHITFGGSVVAAGKTTTIDGELKAVPTNKFADIYVRLNLSDTTGAKHNLEAYVIDNRALENGEIEVYINYNNFKVTISHISALKIIGAVRDIMGLKIEFLDSMLEGVYEEMDTSVFDTLDIAGLSELREQINGLFKTAEDASDSVGGGTDITGMLNESLIDNILSGVSFAYENETLKIKIDNGIFEPLNKGEQAIIALNHDNQQLTGVSINNLVVNGNSVNFNASLSCEPFDAITAPTDHRDFNFIDELLGSLITTASMREFEISGTLNLNLVGIIKPQVPFNVKVKILDDGTTAAAIKLEVPFVSGAVFAALTKSDSYIYFVNNRLYFIADVWDSWAWSAGSYSYTETKSCTVEEFMANPTDYLFFLLRMADIIKNPIVDAINKGSGGTSGSLDLNAILKNFSSNGDSYKLVLGLKELTGNKDLSDINVDIATNQNYITNLKFSTSFAGAVDLNLGDGANLINIKEENGVKCGANPSSNVSFGHKYNGDKTNRIDTLEDDLAKMFVIEAAETFAFKLDNFTDRTRRAGEQVTKAVADAKKAAEKVEETKKAYLSAKDYLDGLDSEGFGYELAVNQYNRTQSAYNKALVNIETANANRSVKAQAVLNNSALSINMLDKTATAAENSANYQTDSNVIKLRASTAAATATNSILSSLSLTNKALQTSLAAAKADNNTALATQIQNKLDELKLIAPTVSLKTANAAIKSGSFAITVMESASTAANTAANAGNATEALTKAIDAASAIDSVTTITKAANAAAKISENAEAIKLANDNLTLAESKKPLAATLGLQAALYASNNLRASATTNANASLESANNGDIANAVTSGNTSLSQLKNSITAANLAITVSKHVSDTQLIASAKEAFTNCSEAAKTVAQAVITAMANSAESLQADCNAKIATAISSPSNNNTNLALNVLDQFKSLSATARAALDIVNNEANQSINVKIKLAETASAINLANLTPVILSQIDSSVNDITAKAKTVYDYKRNSDWTYNRGLDAIKALNGSISSLNTHLATLNRLNDYINNLLSNELISSDVDYLNTVLNAVKSCIATQQEIIKSSQEICNVSISSADKFYSSVNNDMALLYKSDCLNTATATKETANTSIETSVSVYNSLSSLTVLRDNLLSKIAELSPSQQAA